MIDPTDVPAIDDYSKLLDGRVAVVTGGGSGGIGGSIATLFAQHGALVEIAEIDPQRAEESVAAIEAAGGTAIADPADVTDFAQVTAMIDRVMARWGRIDILVNNAGILRDKSFAKMELGDFRAVIEVHLMGAVHCTKAVWDIMRAQNYGRIVLTSSSSGLYGNFGQANYGAAKAAMIGLMNVLHHEGQKNDIRVNILSPTAATRMTQSLLPEADQDLLTPESVTPGLLYLVSEAAPSRMMLCAGAGCFARAVLEETEGIYLREDDRTPEMIAQHLGDISSPERQAALADAWSQTKKYVAMAKDMRKR